MNLSLGYPENLFSTLPAGNHRVGCASPNCDEKRTKRNVSLTVDSSGAWVSYCHRCGASRHSNGSPRHGAAPAARHAPAPHIRLAGDWRDFWSRLRPIEGVALDYLRARKCLIPPADGDLRYHDALRHPSGYVGPALVARVTDIHTGEPLTLHRTWIQANGRKADLEQPRLLLGRHTKRNGVIRLWPDEAVTSGLAVAEGIESALSVAHAYTPAWACIDAGNLGKLPVLDGIRSLLIAADNDRSGTGQRAAKECADRWHHAGREVRIVMSPVVGQDLNDVAMTSAA